MKVADMHCDTISSLYNKDNTINKNTYFPNLRNNHLHIDLDKMKKGDYLVQNFALFINLQGEDDPLERCLKLIDLFYRELEKNKDIIGQALNVNDIMENERRGKMSAILTIEEGGVTKGSLAHLRNLYRIGVRMLTLTWNYENEIGYPSLERTRSQNSKAKPSQNGLKDFGIKFIQEMEQLGMMIDVSHLSDDGIEDVLKYTKTPFVASHSNARAVCNHPRNLPDNLIKQMANRGCVIGMNFYPEFLEDKAPADEILETQNKGTISSIVTNIKHIINIGGSGCVGLGSDFDGISGHAELKDASYLPKLAETLEEAGIPHQTIHKIFYKNVLNLYKEVLG